MTPLLSRVFYALLILFAVQCSLSAQTDYYVSATAGSDANTGADWASSFASLDHAVDVVIAQGNNNTEYNIYVAEGTYGWNSAKQLNGSYLLNIYGGFPTPTATTPPNDVCNFSIEEYETHFAFPNSLSNSAFRLKGDGGGLTVHNFHYNSTMDGGIGDGSFITLDGDGTSGSDGGANDSRNKIIVLDYFNVTEYRASSGGFIYLYDAENIQIDINNTFVLGGGASPSGGAFVATRLGSPSALSRNIDVTVNRSSFQNITTSGNSGGALFSIRQDFNKDMGESSLTFLNSSFCNVQNAQPATVAGAAALLVQDLKDVVIENSVFTDGRAAEGAAIRAINSRFDITNTVFSNNRSTNEGGAITVEGIYPKSGYPQADLASVITDSKFYNNRASISGADGGAISFEADADLIISGSEFQMNRVNDSSVGTGGAIFYSGSKNLRISTTTFCRNMAATDGGAIDIEDGTLYSTSNTYLMNEGTDGAAIKSVGNGSITSTGDTFSGNTADDNGGGIYFSNGTLQLTGSTFSGNTGAGDGGAIYHLGGTLTAQGNIFSNNVAGDDGGAINTSQVNSTFMGDEFYNNSTIGNLNSSGGALYLDGTSTDNTIALAVIQNSVFKENTADAEGGAVTINDNLTTVTSGARVTFSGSTFYGNVINGAGPDLGGGAILINDVRAGIVFTDNNFYNNAANNQPTTYSTITPSGGGGGAIKIIGLSSTPNDNVTTFTGNTFAGNTVNSDANLSWRDGGSDIRLIQVVIADNPVENNNFQTNQVNYDYYNISAGSGFTNLAPSTNTFNYNTVVEPPTPTLPPVSCPTIPAVIECFPVEDILTPANFVSTDPADYQADYAEVCEGDAGSVSFVSTLGQAPFTYTYTLVTYDENGNELSNAPNQTTATANSPITVTTPNTGAAGTVYEYILTSVTDAVPATTDYTCETGALVARVKVVDCTIDTDGDGVLDINDADADNDGIPDAIEVGDNPAFPVDSDSDGVPDYLDLDSDNDGINDVVEGGDGAYDTNGDGYIDDNDTGYVDANNDGQADNTVANDGNETDSDSNGTPDYQDPVDSTGDTDSDGYPDGPDADGDGILDVDDDNDYEFGEPELPDTDGDGIPDIDESGGVDPNEDADGDGVPAYLDDDDNDNGVGNDDMMIEDGFDTDGDGTPNFRDADSDNDGIPDSVEAGSDPLNPVDTDGDSIPDFLDLDSDNDGLNDVDEGGDGDLDTNNDGVIDSNDAGFVDANNDGQADGSTGNDGSLPMTGSVPDYQDPVGGGSFPTGPDTDGDGILDSDDSDSTTFGETADSDSDGIPDDEEGYDPADPTNSTDTDGDGTPDYIDADSDNDGIPDGVEVGADPTNPVDTDGDGVPDYRDLDSDNDGLNDVDEGGDGNLDTNNDGVINSDDTGFVDADGDGQSDGSTANDGSLPMTGGVPDYQNPVGGGPFPTGPDADGDGILDDNDTDDTSFGELPDADGDGIPDEDEGYDPSDPTNSTDTDGDGTPDYLDDDSDGDGVPDEIEAGDDPQNPVDTDGDGIPDFRDGDSDNDGIPDGVEAGTDPTNPVDTDGDGVPDYLDLDSDNDGLNDVDEGGDGDLDTNNDGIIDSNDDGYVDADGDGQSDASTGNDGNLPMTGGIPDYQNPASGSPLTGPDADGDGIIDQFDSDDTMFGEADCPINITPDSFPWGGSSNNIQ